MDWDFAIKRNSEALKGMVEALFALRGLDGQASVSRIPHRLHRAVLRVLKPADCRPAPHCRCGSGVGGEGGAVASHAQGT